LPESLKESAMRLAEQDGVSLNQWIVAAVAQKIGAVESAEGFLKDRAAGAKAGGLLGLLDNAPDRPSEPSDELLDSRAVER
jgi:hypothetical protein